MSTNVLATYGFHEAFDFGYPQDSGGGNDLGAAAANSGHDCSDASRPRDRGATVRARRTMLRGGAVALGLVLLVWTLLPVWNMVLIALKFDADQFTGSISPPIPISPASRRCGTRLLGCWSISRHSFGNSVIMGLGTVALTVLIGSLASFALSRLRLRHGWIITDAALLTYVLPMAFLAIPSSISCIFTDCRIVCGP